MGRPALRMHFAIVNLKRMLCASVPASDELSKDEQHRIGLRRSPRRRSAGRFYHLAHPDIVALTHRPLSAADSWAKYLSPESERSDARKCLRSRLLPLAV